MAGLEGRDAGRIGQRGRSAACPGGCDPAAECPGDGAALLARADPESFDAVLVDAPDPVGHAESIFSPSFYRHCRRVLRPKGVLAVQSDSPFTMPSVTRRIGALFHALFPVVRVCYAVVPTCAGNLWTFTVASLGADPADPAAAGRAETLEGCRYWSPRLHGGAFALPAFVERLLAPADAARDAAVGAVGGPLGDGPARRR